MKKLVLLIVITSISALQACRPAAQSAKSEAGQNITYTCAGNEPFWSAQISSKEIVFNHADMGKSVYPYQAPVVQDNTLIFNTSAGGSRIKITIATQPCEDSMSGAAFPFTATVQRDADTFTGCAESNLQPRKGGER